MLNTKDEVYEEVYLYLQDQININPTFKLELEELLRFYGNKLMSFAKNEEEEEFVIDGFEDVVTSQYFNGYYVMSKMLKEAEFDIEWSLPTGILRNELPMFLHEVFKEEVEDWSITDVGHSFSMKLLEFNANTFDITSQIRRDLSNYGAYKAFIENEQYKGDMHDSVELTPLIKRNPLDFHFLNPQVYMQVAFITNENEVWDIYNWSSISEKQWVGSVNLSRVDSGDQFKFMLELKLSDIITKDEKNTILNEVKKNVSSEVNDTLQVRMYHINSMEVYN